MFDSVDVSTIPRRPFAVAGYSDGFWPTFAGIRRAYPRAHTVSIAVFAWDHAACLDVEPGDAAPWEVPGWVRADEHAGYRKPCVYSDWSQWVNEVRPTLTRAGLSRANVYEWDASYTSRPHLDPGFDATQWTDRCLGRNLDCSLVLPSFLLIARPPLNPPAPKPKPNRSQRLRTLDALLGAHSGHNHGHNCADPPYRHAFPSAAYDHACSVWSREARALR